MNMMAIKICVSVGMPPWIRASEAVKFFSHSGDIDDDDVAKRMAK